MTNDKTFKLVIESAGGNRITEIPLVKNDDDYILCLDGEKVITTRELSHAEIIDSQIHTLVNLVGGALEYDPKTANDEESERCAAICLSVAYEVFHNLWNSVNPEHIKFDDVMTEVKSNMDEMMRDFAKKYDDSATVDTIEHLLDMLKDLREDIEKIQK